MGRVVEPLPRLKASKRDPASLRIINNAQKTGADSKTNPLRSLNVMSLFEQVRYTCSMGFCDDIKKTYQLFPYACHVTHIDNLSGIIKKGFLLSKKRLDAAGVNYEDISDSGIQDKRSQIIVPGTSRNLHEYVPFFFTYKAPMIAKRQSENENLVYLQVSLDILQRNGVAITDGNATSRKSEVRLFTDLRDLAILDLSILQKSIRYAADDEKKRKKAAEILVPDKLEWGSIERLICFNEAAKTRVLSVLSAFGMTIEVWIKKDWFY